jgi:hypothetical protein
MVEVLKQTLEAMKNGVDGQTSIEMDEAITSLRQAIAGLESQEPLAWMKPDVLCDRACMYLCTKGFTQFPECATAPPQRTEQEPVECDGDFPEGFDKSLDIPAQALRQANAALCEVTNNRMWDVPALAERMLMFCRNTHPPQSTEQEPQIAFNAEVVGYIAPQRTWVGLTKDEVDSWNLPDHPTVFEFAQFIESKLKEKNI